MMNDKPTGRPVEDTLEHDAHLARQVRSLARRSPHHEQFTSELKARLLRQADTQGVRAPAASDHRGAPLPTLARGRRLWLRLAPRYRPVVAAAAFVAALVIGGAGYAAVSLVDESMSVRPGLASVVQQYGKPLNLTRGACGYTMTLTRVYADANRVVVGYTLGGPSAHHYVALGSDYPVMTDMRGTSLQHIDIGTSLTMQGATGGHFAAFDTSAIGAVMGNFHLRMIMPSIMMVEKVDGTEPRRVPCEAYSDEGTTIRDGDGGATRVRVVTVNSPLSFDIVVPVDRVRHVVELRQTVSAVGGTVTLERIVATRSEVRVYMKTKRPVLIRPDALVSLHIGGQDVQGVPVYQTTTDGRAVFAFVRPLPYSGRDWRLVVRVNPYTEPKELGGPWEFHVAVSL